MEAVCFFSCDNGYFGCLLADRYSLGTFRDGKRADGNTKSNRSGNFDPKAGTTNQRISAKASLGLYWESETECGESTLHFGLKYVTVRKPCKYNYADSVELLVIRHFAELQTKIQTKTCVEKQLKQMRVFILE